MQASEGSTWQQHHRPRSPILIEKRTLRKLRTPSKKTVTLRSRIIPLQSAIMQCQNVNPFQTISTAGQDVPHAERQGLA